MYDDVIDVRHPTGGLWVLETLCPCGGGRARFGGLLSGSGYPASPELSQGHMHYVLLIYTAGCLTPSSLRGAGIHLDHSILAGLALAREILRLASSWQQEAGAGSES